MHVLVLQHIACEPPGVYEEVLRERGGRVHRVELDEGEEPPDPLAFDALVVMGGPMGAYEEAEHPWLGDEKRLLGRAARAGMPVFGACLGAQLLADGLGGRAYQGQAPEVGVLDVRLTDEGRADPVTSGLPSEFPTLQWHADTFDPPPGAVVLASSPAYAHQAFRWGAATYAVQFHLEVTGRMAREWGAVPAYAASLENVRGRGAFAELMGAVAARAGEMQGLARLLFGRWLDEVAPAAS
jgi:GMP synthase (glutamine-hydrolysing)